MANGPCATMSRNTSAVWLSARDSTMNSTAPTSATPMTDPTERDNWTAAAAEPSMPAPACACAVTCATGMAEPWNKAANVSTAGMLNNPRCRTDTAMTARIRQVSG